MLKRLKSFFSANAHAAIDNLENPSKMVDQYVREMESYIKEIQEALVSEISRKKMLETYYTQEVARVETAKTLAEQSIIQGDEDKARRSLQANHHRQQAVDEYKSLVTKADESIAELRTQLDKAQTDYQKLKSERLSVKARYSSAKARESLTKTMNRIQRDSPLSEMNRLQDKVYETEASAYARQEVYQSSNFTSEVNVEKELQELKKKLEV